MFRFGKPNTEKLKANGNIKGLVRALSYKDDVAVRRSAVAALADLKDPASIEGLVNTLQDGDAAVRESIRETLVAFGGTAVPALLEAVGRDQCVQRDDACAIIMRIGRPGVDALLAALDHNQTSTRMAAVTVMSGMSNPRALEGLGRAASRDPEPEVRQAAIDALRRIGGNEGAAQLRLVVSGSPFEESVRAATKALTQLKPSSASIAPQPPEHG